MNAKGQRMGKNIRKRKKRRGKREAAGWIVTSILIFAGVLLITTILGIAGYLWLNGQGRSILSKKQEAAPVHMQRSTDTSEEAEEEAPAPGSIRYNGKTYTYNHEILTFLCMGIDNAGEVRASGNLYKGGQADALFLAVLDGGEAKISIIGINRDTMTDINTYDQNGLFAGKETAQIALAHAYGDGLKESCENTVEAVSNLFYGLPIHGYCALNMSVIPEINDAVGGVTVVIPESADNAVMEIEGINYSTGWKAGEQVHLMGDDAYTFIRYRNTDEAESARARLDRQKQYIRGFTQQARSAVKQNMAMPLQLYHQITPYMVTDITAEEVVYLAGQAMAAGFTEQDIHTLEGEVIMGEIFEEFYPSDTALYELILRVFYEELPN